MTLLPFILGPLETNTYAVIGERDSFVVDPAWESAELLDALRESGVPLAKILITHGHGDHIAGIEWLRGAFPEAVIACPEGDAAMLTDPALNLSSDFGLPLTSPPADELLRPGQTIACAGVEWTVLDTGGHTAGGVSYYGREAGVVFTGDALFAGSVGRVDIPGGSAGRLMKNIRLQLMSLPDDTKVYSGHGPATTIGRERRTNPFVKEYYRLKGGGRSGQ